jgi:large subunit ribosomal protein L4
MELDVYKINGEKTDRKVVFDDELYGGEPNDHAIYLDVKQHEANQRQGTHSTLEKSTMKASTKKLKRQKGTGGARSGSIKSPLFKGGARIFGPRPRDYSFKLNKKVKKLARRSALTYKLKENSIFVIDSIGFEAIKTKQSLELLRNFNISDKKTLLVLAESNKNVILSSRNLQRVKVILASNLTTYDILDATNILIDERSVSKIQEIV